MSLSPLARVALLVTTTSLLAGCAPERPAGEREAYGSRPDLPYSEAVRHGDTYHFAGKVGATDATRALTEGRTAAETRNVLEGFREALERVGLGFDDVLSTNVYLVQIEDFEAMNAVYREYFPSAPPARTTVGVAGLPGGSVVEIALIAARSGPQP